MSTPYLVTEDLAVGYARSRRTSIAVAEHLGLTVSQGELVCLVGANGAGKSTLLRTLAAMQPPLAGRVRLGSDDLQHLSAAAVARRLAVVLTDRVTVGALAVYELAALGRHPYTGWAGRLDAADHEAVRQAMESVGIRGLASRQVDELSDGERQKVMIARALAQQTPLLVLDEITAFLDLPRRVEIMGLLRDLAHEDGKAILVSTHDLDLALRTADTIWLLSEGKLEVGSPETLVLAGALERAFRSDALEFDHHSGTFRPRRAAAARIRIEGEGLGAHWTARALERHGFDIRTADGHPDVPCVRVVRDRDGWRWSAHANGTQTEHASLDALTHFLRQHVRPGTPPAERPARSD